MTDFKVLITDYTWDTIDLETSVLAEVGATPIVAQYGSEKELTGLVRDADAILTCFAHVTPAVIDAGPKLQVVGRYGIGVDNIAVDRATRLGIPVTNVPAYCLDEVAEHVLACCSVWPGDQPFRSKRSRGQLVARGRRDRSTNSPRRRADSRRNRVREDRADRRPRASGIGLNVIPTTRMRPMSRSPQPGSRQSTYPTCRTG